MKKLSTATWKSLNAFANVWLVALIYFLLFHLLVVFGWL